MLAALRRGWYALVPASVALALGLWGIATPGLWFDERFTVAAVTEGLGSALWEAPLLPYYALMWIWTGGGQWIDEGWLRLPSVLAIAVASAVVAVTARRIATVQAGLAAGMLFAMAPGVARYAQEARTYALAAALVAMATLALVSVMSGQRRRWWIGYGVAMGAAVLIIPVTLMVLPVHAVIVTTFPGWRSHVRDFVATWLFLSPIIAVEVLMAFWASHMHAWLEPPEVADLARGLTIIGDSEWTGTVGTSYALVLVVLAALTPLGLRWLSGLAVAVLVVFVVSVVMDSWWLPRTFLPLTGIMCVAAGLALAKAEWSRVVVVLGVLAIVALPAYRSIKEPGTRGTDAAEIARTMDGLGRAGDRVRVPATGSIAWWAVQHYLRDDPRFTPSPTGGAGRYWEMGETPTCVDFRQWNVTGGDVLRLCL